MFSVHNSFHFIFPNFDFRKRRFGTKDVSATKSCRNVFRHLVAETSCAETSGIPWVDLEKCQVLGRQHIDFDPIPFDPIRPQSIRPKLFDQKGRPNSFRPISFDPFHAIRRNLLHIANFFKKNLCIIATLKTSTGRLRKWLV